MLKTIKSTTYITLLFIIILIEGCASPSGIDKNIPKNSPLSEIKIGMSRQEVIDILGTPFDRKEAVMPNGRIPIANMYAPDTNETTYYYRNLGLIVFSNPAGSPTSRFVRRVEYNPEESGYARR